MIIDLIGIPVIFVLGSLFHFLYKYGGKKIWMALVSPVNESIWEHLKIAFYPGLIYTAVQLSLKEYALGRFLAADIIGIYLMIAFILVAEWIYPKFLKRYVLAIDLTVFFVAITISQLSSYWIYEKTPWDASVIYLLLIILLQIIIFGTFSVKPPHLPLFKDSVDEKYGIK